MNEISPTFQLNGQLSMVLFNEDPLVLAEHNTQPYVVMRALVTAMGLDWRSQYVKLMDKFGATVVEITTVAEDGKPRAMVCLPLRKLPGWLYSINAGKLSEALRPKVLQYQQECDEVLWRHWTSQQPPNAGRGLTAAEHNALLKRRSALRRELAACAAHPVALEAYADYLHASALLGMPVGTLQALAPAARQQALPGV